LIEAARPIDDDLTDVTDSELVALIARYLLCQEGIDARVERAPPIDDPAWEQLAASSSGELYDLAEVQRAIGAWLVAAPAPGLSPPATLEPRQLAGALRQVRAADGDLQRMRLYCKLRGIELGYRSAAEAGRRARGLQVALELAAKGRGGQRILVLSD